MFYIFSIHFYELLLKFIQVYLNTDRFILDSPYSIRFTLKNQEYSICGKKFVASIHSHIFIFNQTCHIRAWAWFVCANFHFCLNQSFRKNATSFYNKTSTAATAYLLFYTKIKLRLMKARCFLCSYSISSSQIYGKHRKGNKSPDIRHERKLDLRFLKIQCRSAFKREKRMLHDELIG